MFNISEEADVDQEMSDDAVFTDPEVAHHFVHCINKDQDKHLASEDIWRWLRTPPLETIVK